MYQLRYTLLCVLFILFGLNTAFSQVWEVDFMIEYNTDSCHYDAKIVIQDGSAISVADRSQFNSSYSFVIPADATFSVIRAYEPKVFAFPPTVPTEWAIGNSMVAPNYDPSLQFLQVIPEIDPLCVYGNVFAGDTITVFSFMVDGIDMCGEEIRLFENGTDPSSLDLFNAGDAALDFSNGFTMGSPDQIYGKNLDAPGPPKPEVTFTVDCSGDVTIIPEPIEGGDVCADRLPYSYMWSGPNGFSSTDENPIVPAGTGPGTYCATIVDNYGCDTIICQDLVIDVATPIEETVCTTDPYDLIFVAGGSGNWVFDPSSNMSDASIGSTSSGTATVTFTSSATGTYSFLFENDGCGGTAEITLMPAASEPNVIADGPKCPGETTLITADAISGATYNWNNEGAQSDNTYTVGGPEMVTLEVIVGGCPSSTTIDVTYLETPATPTLGVTNPVCEGDLVEFTASNITGANDNDYFWTGPNNYNEQNPSITSVSSSDAGIYEVIVEIDGCPSVLASIELVVDSKPTTPTIDPIADVCEGETIQFNTSASATTYTWTQTPSNNVLSGQNPSITGATSADAGTYTLVINDGGCDSEEATVIVVVDPKPETPTITATSPVCVGQEIEFTSSTVSGATYAWYLSSTLVFSTQNHTISAAALSDGGIYTVIATIDGCDSDPVTVEVVVNNTSPAPNATIESPVCTDDDVDFSTDVVSGATYTWTNSSCPNSPIITNDASFTLNNITANCAGTWELTVDLAGCISEPGMANLVINATPNTPAPTSNTDLCVGEDLMLFANVTADMYEWYFDSFLFSTDQDPTVSDVQLVDGGIYTLIIKNNGCPSEAGTTVVVVNEVPSIPDVASNGPFCTNENIELFTSVIADSYTWTGPGPSFIEMPDQNPTYTGSAAIAGDYTLVVTQDGCESEEATINVVINTTPAVPNISANGPLCTGMDLELTTDAVAGAMYMWEGPTGFTFSEQNPTYEDVTLDQDGTYELTVIVDGCPSQTVTVNVDVYESPTTPTATVNPVCAGDDIMLMSSADPTLGHLWTYTGSGTNAGWTSIQANPTITDAMASAHDGVYTLVITESGCSSDTAFVTVTVTELAEPTTGTYGPFCLEDDPITLSGTPAGIFSGDGVNAAGDTFTPNDAGQGTHTLTLTITDGTCSATNTVVVLVNPLPTVTAISSDDDICIGETVTLTGGGADTYDWNDGTSSIGTDAMFDVTPTATTTYELTGTDANGCENTATVTITVNPLPTVTASSSDDVICIGETVTLTGNGASTYEWTEAGSSISIDAMVDVTPSVTTTYEVTGTDANGCENTATVTITVNPLPTVTATSSDDVICIGETVTLTGGGADTYDWSDGTVSIGTGTTIDVTPSVTTTYEVTGTDANGCENTATVTITVNPLPTVTATASDDVICIGETVTLTGGGADTYDWNDGTSSVSTDAMFDVTPSVTTTYEVTGTDANGCENTATVTITVNPLPTVTATANDDVICVGETVTLTGGGADTYDWSDGTVSIGTGTTIDVTPSATTTYEVTGTDANGCENTATVTITVNPLPTVTASASDDEICVGETVTLTGGGADTYDWSDGTVSIGTGTTIDVTPSVTTTYEVTGTDANGCENTATVTITVNPLPTVTATASDDVICIGETVTLTGGGADTYDWNDGTSSISTDAMFDVTPSVTTTYEVTGTDANGCENTASVTITVNPLPTVTATANDDVICVGETVTLTGGGADTYDWSDGTVSIGTGTTIDVTPSVTTTYEVTGTDANGCENTATVTITVNPLPTVTATASDDEICVGETVTLTGGGADTYDWNDGTVSIGTGTTIDVTPSVTTTYEVTGTDANGCENTATVTITVNPLPTVTATASDDVICIGETVTLSGGGADTYDWNDGTVSIGTGTTIDVTPSVTTTYEVTGTDANGCENTATVTITVNPLPTITASASNENICIGESTTLTGSGAIDYDWGLDGTGENIDVSPTETTTYTVTGTDANGCENTATVTITVNPLPEIEIVATETTICVGESTDLTASGGGNYEWTPALTSDATQTVSPTETTTYTVIGSNSAGCEDIATITITVNPLPVIFPGDYSPICVDANPLALSGNPNGGTFSGHPAIDGNFFDPAVSGSGVFTITYTASENGCENSATVDLTVNDLPIVDANIWGPYCDYDNDVTLIGDPAGGTFSGNGVVNNVFSPEGAGPDTHEITYTYTDGNGCTNTSTTSIIVNAKPIVEAGIYPDVCLDSGDFELVGNPAGGTFSGLGVSSDGTMFEPSTAGVNTHTITYIYEDPITGCSDQATAEITVVATPDAPIVMSNSPVCAGETISITVDGVSGGTYMWTGPNGLVSTMQDINLTDAIALQGGIYSVKVTVDGCDSEWSDIEVVVNPIPDTPVPTSNGPVCEGETIILMTDSVDDATYAWSGPDGMTSTEQNPEVQMATKDNEGQYCLIVTVDGCESEFACIDVIVNDIPDAPIITTSAPVCIGTDISFGTDVVADAYQWYDQDGNEFSTDQFPVLTGSTLDHIGDWCLDVTIDGCVSPQGCIPVMINEMPTVDAGTYADVCADDDAVTLVGSPLNGTFSINSVELTSFDPADFAAGPHVIDYVFQDVNGCENSASTTINVNATPTLELVSIDCSADLNSYTVTFSSDATVTAGGETVSGNQVIDILITDNVMLIATSADGCTVELPVSAPQCNCADVAVAVSGGDVEICLGEITPVVSASANAGLVIDWFATPTGGSALDTGFDYQSPETTVGVYTYYAEARNPVDDCVSSTRTPITLTIKALPMITNTDLTATICSGDMTPGFELTSDMAGTTYTWSAVVVDIDGSFSNGVGNIPSEAITTSATQGVVTYTVIPSLNGCAGEPVDFVVTVNGLPTITIDNKECSADLSTYTITYTSDFDVTSTEGSPITNGFEGIVSGNTVTLTVTNTVTGCTEEVIVTAPQCDCNDVDAPINPMNQEICVNDLAEALTVEVGTDISVNWFSTPVGGTSLGSGTSFTPDDVLVGVYTYYAEATDDITECIGTIRTEVTYTINELPSITIDSKTCTSDLSMYVISYSGTDVTVTSSEGTQVGTEITVAANVNTTLTITDDITGCISTLDVDAPDCDCSIIAAPISGGNEVICENETIPTLTVTVEAGMQANWYQNNALVAGGENTLSYTPSLGTPDIYIYEVEAVNPTDNCVSATKTEVRLTINALPTVAISDKVCSADLQTYSMTVTTDGTFTTSHGIENGNEITGIPEGQTVTLTITKDGCTITELVTAPMCACDPIDAPVIADEAICINETIPTFTATLGADETIDWFESDCTTPIVTSTSFMPLDVDAGVYTYCAQIRNTLDDCTSDATTFIFTINELPSITIDSKTCSPDMLTYIVVFTGTDVTVSPSEGSISGNEITVDANVTTTLTITDNTTGCESTLEITAPDCACDPIDTPVIANEEICIGATNPTFSATAGVNEEVNWYASDCTTLLSTGPSFTPGDLDAGVYTYCVQIENTLDGCTSDAATFTFTINELPAISLVSTTCSSDFSTYDAVVTGTGVISVSPAGFVNGNTIEGIPANTNITVTITDANGCANTLDVTAPTCACDPIDPPVSGGDMEICFGDANPVLTASVSGTDEVVEWYESDCTTLLGTGDTFIPTPTDAGVYTYCLITRNSTDNCISDMTTTVSFTINELPTITFGTPECSADLSTYSVTFTSTDNVSATPGIVIGNTITDIPTGMDVEVTVEDINNCSTTVTITAPVCACDDVDEPVITNNDSVCLNETNTELTVSTVAGTTVTWYDSAIDGLVLSTDLTYTSLETEAGTYTYYVEAVNTTTGCISDRIPVTFTIQALPTISVDMKECAADNQTYNVTFSGDVTLTSVTPSGTISGMMIIDIMANTDITLTFTDNVTGCENTQVITAPNCDCALVDTSISSGDEVICFGDTNPLLSVQAVTDITFNWYTESTGGTLLETGETYMPTDDQVGVHTYHVEAIAADGCISNTRTEITLTINALPTLVEDMKSCDASLLTYSVTLITSGDITSHSAGDLNGTEIANIPIGVTLEVTVTDAATGCEEEFEIVAPTCDCNDVLEPTVTNDEVCFGDTNPMLTATTIAGHTIDWYGLEVGGTPLLVGSDMYQPTDSGVGIITVWAVARNIDNGCESDRVPVTLTINELPILENIDTECTSDLSMYSISFNTTATITATSAGTLSGNQIIDILSGTDVQIDIIDPITGCMNTILVLAPDCDCIDIDAPVSGGNEEICFGETNPVLTASTIAGSELRWYVDNTINIPFQTGTDSYIVSDSAPGIYSVFVSATDVLTGCESDRIEISLTINEEPMITNVDREQTICSGDISTGFVIESDQINTTYTWTAIGQDVTGLQANGSGNISALELTNISTLEGSVTYTVTPTLNGCVGDAVEFIVFVNPTPNAGTAQSTECFIDAEFTMAATGAGTWTPANSSAQSITIENANDPNTRMTGFASAGSYDFEWTVNGCSEIVTLTINDNCPCIIESNIVIDNVDATYCMTTGTLLLVGEEASPSGGTYTWEVSLDGQPFVPAQGINNTRDYDASNLGSGNYQFRRLYDVITTDGECSDESNELEFLVFTDKVTPGDIMFDPNPVCQGDTLFLMVADYNPNLTYNWSVSSGNARVIYQLDSMSNVVVESSGTITVAVTQSLDGCVDASASNPTTLDINVNPSPRFNLGIDTTFCELDATYFLDAGDFEEYLWQDGSDDQDFEVEGEGIYSVTVTDTVGCQATDEIDIKSFCCDFAWPNIIKADGRGNNSVFEITDVYGCAISSELYIYDRWGNLMFIGKDTTEWDGFFKGRPVEQGVYVFIYKYMAKDADREIFEGELKGDITVIRDR